MSTAHNAINNSIGTSGTTTSLTRTRSGSGQWDGYDDQTDTFGFYNNDVSPEGVVAANIGSRCVDTTNGTLYLKTTDTVNTGWVVLAPNLTPTVLTWTPNLQFGGAQVGITYGTQVGYYIRIGNLVACGMTVTLTSKGSSVGNATVSNLPITSSAVTSATAQLSTMFTTGITLTGGRTIPMGGSFTNSSTVYTMNQYGTGLATATITDAMFANTSSFGGSFSYFS